MMKPVFAMLSLLVVVTLAVPVPPTSTSTTTSAATVTSTSTSTPRLPLPLSNRVLPNVDSRLKPKQVNVLAPSSPYRFKLSTDASSATASKRATQVGGNLSPTLAKSSASSMANTEKNWLLTKAWLIDNINRLRRELSELERDYSQHLDTAERANAQKEKQFIEDITKLRADHTVLSQQQKQIIYLIKRNQMLRGRPISENDIQYVSLNGKLRGKVADSHIKRQVKRDLSQGSGRQPEPSVASESFESLTRRNMKEVFGELSALHDLTLTLFADMRSIEHKIENRDKFQ